jgi:hypothetical protein
MTAARQNSAARLKGDLLPDKYVLAAVLPAAARALRLLAEKSALTIVLSSPPQLFTWKVS